MHHPLKIGDKIMSVGGEFSHDEEDSPRNTELNAVGLIVSVDQYVDAGWTYGVQFRNKVFVFIDQSQLDDTNDYKLL